MPRESPALQPRSPAGADEGGWEEEEGEQQDFGQPSGQVKGATAAPRGCGGGSTQPLWANRLLLSLVRLCFPHRAISGPGAAFQLQQETIKKFVLFLVQEKRW